MTVAQMLAAISSYELTEWRTLEQIEPFGEKRADLRTAMLCYFMALPHWKKNAPPPKLEDFMLNFEDPKEQSLEEIKTVLKSISSTVT